MIFTSNHLDTRFRGYDHSNIKDQRVMPAKVSGKKPLHFNDGLSEGDFSSRFSGLGMTFFFIIIPKTF